MARNGGFYVFTRSPISVFDSIPFCIPPLYTSLWMKDYSIPCARVILIVDDNQEMRRTLRELLREVDPDVRECETGEEAVAFCATHKPDWVVMDVKMPAMDGIAATARITRDHPGARIVIVTNFDDPFLRLAAHQAGAVGYVHKDDLSVLEDMIKQPRHRT